MSLLLPRAGNYDYGTAASSRFISWASTVLPSTQSLMYLYVLEDHHPCANSSASNGHLRHENFNF